MSKRRELLTGFASRRLLTEPICYPARDAPFPCGQLRGILPHAGGRRYPPCPTSPRLATGAAHVSPALRHKLPQALPGYGRPLPLGRGAADKPGGSLLLGGVRTRPGGAPATLGLPTFGVWLGLARPRRGAASWGGGQGPAPGLSLTRLPSGCGGATPGSRRGDGSSQHPSWVPGQVVGFRAPSSPGPGGGQLPEEAGVLGPEGEHLHGRALLPRHAPAHCGGRERCEWKPFLGFFLGSVTAKYQLWRQAGCSPAMLRSPPCEGALVCAEEVLLSHSVRHPPARAHRPLLARQSLGEKKRGKKSGFPPLHSGKEPQF